jgi:HlyD family secretion protein
MKMSLNRIAGSLIVFSLVGAVALSGCSQEIASARGVAEPRSEVLAARPMDRTVRATGYIQPAAEIKLSFQQPGTAQAVAVEVAQAVKQGEVLAQLDTTDLELAQQQAQAVLAQAKLALQTAQAQVIVATDNYSRTVEGSRQADIDAASAAYTAAVKAYDKVKAGAQPEDYAQAEANYRNAEATVKRAQADYDRAYAANPAGIGGSPAGLALEQATNNFSAARSMYDKVAKPADAATLAAAYQQVQSAKAALDRVNQPARSFDVEQAATAIAQAKLAVQSAQVQVQVAEIQVKQAQRRIDQATVRAPVDGQVSAVNVKVGEVVGTQPVIAMVDNRQYYIDITVDEIDIAQVKVGQAVQVALDALAGHAITGTVQRINPTSSTVNGVVSYTVRVAVSGDASGNAAPLRAGMTARTSIVVDQRAGVLQAPNWAIRTDAQTGKTYLTVKDGNKTQEVEVTLGERGNTYSEVLSGVQAGQTVVAPN